MDAIAILDIGKTNTKVTLVADGRVIEQRRRHSESHPAPPYLHLANDVIWDWALAQLADLARQFNITDIVPVAHGASVAVIDGAGLVLLERAELGEVRSPIERERQRRPRQREVAAARDGHPRHQVGQ